MMYPKRIVIDFDKATEDDWQTVYDTLAKAGESTEPEEVDKAGVYIGKRIPAMGEE